MNLTSGGIDGVPKQGVTAAQKVKYGRVTVIVIRDSKFRTRPDSSDRPEGYQRHKATQCEYGIEASRPEQGAATPTNPINRN
jgi:hypothetical protein